MFWTSRILQHFQTLDLEVPNVRRELVEGPAAACIVERAAAMEAPLIMMPTRRHTRFRQLLLGSVTAAVLHDAACPVWTDAHMEDGPDLTGVVNGIMGAVAKHEADLLIIGRGVIQGPLGRLRTNAHEIIGRSRCAVLSV